MPLKITLEHWGDLRIEYGIVTLMLYVVVLMKMYMIIE